MTSRAWIESCRVYACLIRLLVTSYIEEMQLIKIVMLIKERVNEFSIEPDHFRRHVLADGLIRTDQSEEAWMRADVDLAYLFNWEEFENTFSEHLQILTGNTDVLKDFHCISKGIRSFLITTF